jgi:hypothetical protein
VYVCAGTGLRRTEFFNSELSGSISLFAQGGIPDTGEQWPGVSHGHDTSTVLNKHFATTRIVDSEQENNRSTIRIDEKCIIDTVLLSLLFVL